MNRTELEHFVGKAVIVELRNTFHYTGNIRTVTDNSIVFTDKFNKSHLFASDTIVHVAEVD